MLWNKILLIYDGTENSLRTVEFTANMFRRTEGASVTILGIFEKIPQHDLQNTSPIVDKLKHGIISMEIDVERGQNQILEYKKLLLRSGFDEHNIAVKYVERKASAAKDIIAEVEAGGYGTILMARGESRGALTGGSGVIKELTAQLTTQALIVV